MLPAKRQNKQPRNPLPPHRLADGKIHHIRLIQNALASDIAENGIAVFCNQPETQLVLKLI